MFVKDMFEKDIERSIKGVIKVGQQEDDSLEQEIEEYVVTKEITKHFSKFYSNYQKSIDGNTDKIGVWISGFFGSGKSHFLKILSCLLDNKKIDNKYTIDYFDDKINDPMLYSEMKRLANQNTEVILFNIDSQSDYDGKNQADGILKAFKKVFNVHRGFYGGNFGIAEMEIKLSEEGVFEAFKEEFFKIKGKTWEERRRSFRFDGDAVIKSLMTVTNMSEDTVRDWHKNCLKEFKFSINDFSIEVKKYINSKPKGFHLIFLVDEVGQYIGNETKLMVNLQTMAEDLGSSCKGKAWIAVTSQESIDELSKNIKGDDFSKIQGRFDTRLSLSSISASEVIKKRILEKTETSNQKLKMIYLEKSAILNNLITFKNATGNFNSYSNADEFAECYPFVPYEFKLLQNVFEQIRKHGSSGKHLSEGERSMLSAFKESAYEVRNEDEGVLVPFYSFFNTISEFLNPSIIRVIANAEENSTLKDNKFNIDLLKILFMLKYIKEITTNIENIATLMVTNINQDKLVLKEKIIKSLDLLIKETLVQKNGEEYIFLTDDEQDINKEIKELNIDESHIKKEMSDIIFNDLCDKKKFRYSKEYDFDYNRKMDEKNYGNQTSEIGINIISPLSDMYNASEVEFLSKSSNFGDVFIKLTEENNYIDEFEEVLKIEEYIKTKNLSSLPENIVAIINGKSAEARDRKKRAKGYLEYALKSADYFINGKNRDVRGTNVQEKINNAFKIQVEEVFFKLSYITDFLVKVEDIDYLIKNKDQQLLLLENEKNNELAIKEVEDFINIENLLNKKILIKSIVDKFSKKPYGWNVIDIIGVVAILFKDQKIKLRQHGKNIDEKTRNIGVLLTKTSEMDTTVVEKREKIDLFLIKKIVRISKNIWDSSNVSSEEDELATHIKKCIANDEQDINKYRQKYNNEDYPGKSLLDKGMEYFNQLNDAKDNKELFIKLQELEDALCQWKEDINLVKSFFDNQKSIFDSGLESCKLYEENTMYIGEASLKDSYYSLREIIDNPIPYRNIKEIPECVVKIKTTVNRIVENKRIDLNEQVDDSINYITLLGREYEETNLISKQAEEQLANIKNISCECYEILKLEGLYKRSNELRSFYEDKIKKAIKEIQEKTDVGTGDKPIQPEKRSKKIRVIDLISIKSITSEKDIDTLVEDLSKKLKEALRNNDDIKFID